MFTFLLDPEVDLLEAARCIRAGGSMPEGGESSERPLPRMADLQERR